MTHDSTRGITRAAFPMPSLGVTKRRRNQLAILRVSAYICPQVVLRVLGLVAQHGAIPYSIGFARRPRSLRVEIVIDSLDQSAAEILLHKIRAVPMVRTARLRSRLRPPTPGAARLG